MKKWNWNSFMRFRTKNSSEIEKEREESFLPLISSQRIASWITRITFPQAIFSISSTVNPAFASAS